ncbi:MAG: exosortase/archaeosortase family protein [Kiritimatiellia bacterium]
MKGNPTTADKESGASKEYNHWLSPVWWGIFAVLFVLLYGVQGNTQETAYLGRSAILWMVRRWSGSGGDLSHAWVIPLISGYVIWRKRRKLATAPRSIHYGGLAVIAVALFLHWAGVRSQLTRLSLLSLLALLWAIPLYLCGPAVARHLLFPCAYLLYCIPFSFLDSITLPLRLVSSAVSSFLLNGLGIPTLRSGTALYAATAGGLHLEVADPCSGLRSLLAMTALTAIYAYFTQKTTLGKVLLFLAAIPIAMTGNIVRIVSTGLAAQGFGRDAALRMYHDYSGYIVFAVSLLLVVISGQVLQKTIAARENR